MSIFEKAKRIVTDKLNEWSLLDISWDNRPYDFYLIFGQDDDSKLPWITDNWKLLFQPYFDTLVKQSEFSKDTGLRVTKYQAEKRFTKKNNKEFIYHTEIKLGRLRWDNKSHEKWTTPNNSDYYFQDFELWTPIWTICDKRQSPPDIFINITNERSFNNKRNTQFGYMIVIAIAKNFNVDSKTVIRELSERINARAAILKTRKWGRPENVGKWTFVNWIQDTFCNGIYQGKNLHSFNFDELEFEPIWEVVYRQK